MLNERRRRGEITEGQYRELIARYARELVTEADIHRMPADDAWQYAEVLIAAENWSLARQVLQVAVNRAVAARNEDRRVNDTLRLARAEANLGNHARALELSRSVFDARAVDKGPILPALLYEIVPAIQGRGRDVELASLLEEAIAQHAQVIVDASSESGKAFLLAKPHHVSRAWARVIQLFEAAGRKDLARKAALRMIASDNKQGQA